MSYTVQKAIDTGVAGEVVVQLPSGDYAAVSCPVTRAPHTQQLVLRPKARWVDATGRPELDTDGEPVETSYTISVHVDLHAANKDALRKAAARLVLGAPLPALVDAAGNAISLCTTRAREDITPAYKAWLADPRRTPQGLVDALAAWQPTFDEAEVSAQVSIQRAIDAAKAAATSSAAGSII